MTLAGAQYAALPSGPRLFPIVSEAQMGRIRRGTLETRRRAERETLVATFGPGQFTGEVNVLADRPVGEGSSVISYVLQHLQE